MKFSSKVVPLVVTASMMPCSASFSFVSKQRATSAPMTKSSQSWSKTSLFSSMDVESLGRLAGGEDQEVALSDNSNNNNMAIGSLASNTPSIVVQEQHISFGDSFTMHVDEAINLGFLAVLALGAAHSIATIDGGFHSGLAFRDSLSHIPTSVWNHYTDVLEHHPVLTKAVTSGTVYTIGDVIAQRTEGTSVADIDRMRACRSMAAGFIGHGPLSHCWYHFSENLFSNVLHCTAWWSFLPKIAVDQSVWGPIWNNTYILLLGLMQRDSWSNMFSDIKRTTVPLVLSGLKLWPLAHCVTYGLIPVENRLLWVDAVEIIWVTILASTAADAHKSHEHEPVPIAEI